VAIAAFDPKLEQFVTRVTPGVPIRVVDVPRFNPESLRYEIPVRRGRPSARAALTWIAGFVAVVLVLAGSTLLGVRLARVRRSRHWRSRRLVDRLIRDVNRAGDPATAGRRINEGIVGYLRLWLDRPPGALTPVEAEQGLLAVTGSSELARRLRVLIARCDQAQFEGEGPTRDELVDEASRLFRELVRWEGIKAEEGESVGENASAENAERGSRDRHDGNGGGQVLPLHDSSQSTR
jgi:hypothetical protein